MSSFTDSAGSKQIHQREHNEDAAAKRTILRGQDPSTGEFVNISASPNGDGTFSLSEGSSLSQAVRIDDTTTANVTYLGKATVGSSEGDAVWQIQKLDETSGLIKTWADSDADYDNIWTNRSSLTYG